MSAEPKSTGVRASGGELPCLFCGKNQNDVRNLVAGPGACICDNCVEVCNEIIAHESLFTARDPDDAGLSAAPAGALGVVLKCALCGMPTESADALVVRGRGVLCPGCLGEIEAAASNMREGQSG